MNVVNDWKTEIAEKVRVALDSCTLFELCELLESRILNIDTLHEILRQSSSLSLSLSLCTWFINNNKNLVIDMSQFRMANRVDLFVIICESQFPSASTSHAVTWKSCSSNCQLWWEPNPKTVWRFQSQIYFHKSDFLQFDQLSFKTESNWVWSTRSLPLLSCPLCLNMVIHVKIQSMGQIDLFKNQSHLWG